MTPRNPLPPQLSHLTQRDAAIRAEERQRAARLCRETPGWVWLTGWPGGLRTAVAEECAAAILGDAP
jgi:hypothetical protein